MIRKAQRVRNKRLFGQPVTDAEVRVALAAAAIRSVLPMQGDVDDFRTQVIKAVLTVGR
jgi:hypothetical protein